MTKQEGRKPGGEDARGEAKSGLNYDTQLKIGEGLRAMYDDVVKQGVPDRFLHLLAEFDQRGGSEKDSEKK